MPPSKFRAAGEALHGENWQSPLARDLAVNRRTIQRWATGQWPVPESAAAELRDLLRQRARHIKQILSA